MGPTPGRDVMGGRQIFYPAIQERKVRLIRVNQFRVVVPLKNSINNRLRPVRNKQSFVVYYS